MWSLGPRPLYALAIAAREDETVGTSNRRGEDQGHKAERWEFGRKMFLVTIRSYNLAPCCSSATTT